MRNQRKKIENESMAVQDQEEVETMKNLETAKIELGDKLEIELPLVQLEGVLELVNISPELVENQKLEESLKGVHEKAEREKLEFFYRK